MAIFLGPCLRLRISGTVTFCGFMGPSRLQKQKSPLDPFQRALQARLRRACSKGIILTVPGGDRRIDSPNVQAMGLKRVSVSVQMDPSGFSTRMGSEVPPSL